MHIGEHEREVIVEPLTIPIPQEAPAVPDTIPAEWEQPEEVPAMVPA